MDLKPFYDAIAFGTRLGSFFRRNCIAEACTSHDNGSPRYLDGASAFPGDQSKKPSVSVNPRLSTVYFIKGATNNALPFSLIIWGKIHISTELASILNAMTEMIGAVAARILLRNEPLTVEIFWFVNSSF